MANLNTMDTTFGALFIGLVLSTILYGIAFLQTFLYYRQYPNDSRLMKSLVFVLWVIDTIHLIFSTITLYHYLISNFNNPAALGQFSWSMNLQTDCNILVGMIVQCFFARRVRIMTGSVILPVIIVVLSTVFFTLGVLFTVEAFILGMAVFPKLLWLIGTGLGSAAVADIMIAVSLCYYLHKQKTGFARPDSLISSLILYTLTTGLITSVLMFLSVITFATMPSNFINAAIFWVTGRCYVNSFMASLNSRDTLREKIAQPQTLVQLTPLCAFSSTAQDTVEPASAEQDISKETLSIGSPALAVNVRVQSLSSAQNEHVVLQRPTATSTRMTV